MKLKIFGLEVPVTIEQIENPHLAAYYDLENHRIVISAEDKHKLASLCHEMIHSMFQRTGLNQTKMPIDVQEIICENISVMIVENWDDLVKFKKQFDKKRRP